MSPKRLRALFASVVMAACSAPLARAETARERFAGRPKFDEGKAFGYFLWQDGNTWKVRWTTFGAERRFNGRVTTEGTEFKSFKRIDVDTERRVLMPGRPARVVRGPRGRVRGVAPGRAPVVASREEDKIEQESEHVLRFLTRTDDDLDGFDFTVTIDSGVLRFVLEIDGARRQAEIEVGRNNFKPMENPIVVRLK